MARYAAGDRVALEHDDVVDAERATRDRSREAGRPAADDGDAAHAGGVLSSASASRPLAAARSRVTSARQ
jgi:hypothetical protein